MNRPSPVGMMLQFAFGSGVPSCKSTNDVATQSTGGMAHDASPQMLALVAAARAWWDGCRPSGWSLEQHLADPIAGCGNTAEERALAQAVAGCIRIPQDC